ncbi:tyrosine-type recombinase/integrase [Clostridium saccharobutylicum]|uniref:DNA integration/recombination protein n=1 Tax=Clostridium saccharobutylicum DSM 13864 TaxID=1345695 RepID=U5MSZ0_CLOSA|nr:tyrosine-type recombinase/integrase [Clostridium saccharobutylicum]AGX43648.1 DNA integration/recombination protein [Clostridium saccharobutylicum DSM 13864]AQR90946.1 tyrosine recombinase XerD [Clostridium saccharobutylicum]AQS00850.1 tyrosine recombinase XerD [Clostridium saccharobutylicum]AQS14833.1 tyrosine recombinase XerD [Clostridium saccharobutylicum]MBA2907124.1 integrase/recombinase XerD [Clostridium saccharobutylicum]
MPKISKNKKSIDDVIVDYLEFCSYKNLTIKTIKSYHQTLMLFSQYLKEEKEIDDIKKITKEIVEEYIQFTKDRGKSSFTYTEEGSKKANIDKRTHIGKEVSNGTLNNYLRNIKAFASYLEEKNISKNTRIHECKFVKIERKAKEQLTDEEYKKLIKCLDCSKFHEFRDYTVINLIFDTGMRLSETLHLTINDIDIVRRIILIPADITKGRKDRVVFFSINMTKLLQRWLKFKDTMQENELLFPTQRTNGIISNPNFERNFRGYLKKTNINKAITPHGLRNNFARRFLLNGGNLLILSKILGHSSVTVTEKAYLDLQDEDLRKKYQKYSPLENMKNKY